MNAELGVQERFRVEKIMTRHRGFPNSLEVYGPLCRKADLCLKTCGAGGTGSW
jgi:hypothetical protein